MHWVCWAGQNRLMCAAAYVLCGHHQWWMCAGVITHDLCVRSLTSTQLHHHLQSWVRVTDQWPYVCRPVLQIFNMPVNLAQGTSVMYAYIIGFSAAPLTALQVRARQWGFACVGRNRSQLRVWPCCVCRASATVVCFAGL